VAEIIVALDLDSAAAVERLLDRLPGLRWAKVGSTLFTREGPGVVRMLQDRGVAVFLDLKWHDIPHQVAGAVRAAADLGVALATVHALGGSAMLEAAQAAAGRMRLVAVTVLTSHDVAALGTVLGRNAPDPAGEAERLARLAGAAGLAGVVASPLEAARLRAVLGDAAWLVIPGIRPAGSAGDDQARTATAGGAARAGATHLVVGRPITRADDPAAVYQQLSAEAVL
jgi:orotidine-5'-phosphate decarboxylase